MDIDMNELRRCRDEINALSAQAKWAPPDENGCTITYLRVRPGTLGNGLSEGICFAYDCQRRKAKEHPKLRKGTKHYIRLVRRNGQLLRVDKYTDGEIDVVHLGQEIDGMRYMFPFFEDGTPYLTYTYATHWKNGRPSAEYACSGGQTCAGLTIIVKTGASVFAISTPSRMETSRSSAGRPPSILPAKRSRSSRPVIGTSG